MGEELLYALKPKSIDTTVSGNGPLPGHSQHDRIKSHSQTKSKIRLLSSINDGGQLFCVSFSRNGRTVKKRQMIKKRAWGMIPLRG